jgi:CRP/FNR family transcriptional regulator, cyclic AMP receptor protein
VAGRTDSNGNEDDFLGSLDDADAVDLRAIARRRVYPRGATVFNEGESSDRIAIVTAGRVKISYFTDEGREVMLAARGPGSLLGDLALIDNRPRSGTVTALEQVEALMVTSADFRLFLESHPRASLCLLGQLAARLREATRRQVEFAAQDSIGRVAARLVELVDEHGEETDEGTRITLPLTQEELAGWTGASREGVSRALQTFRTRGWITTHRRGITVHDRDALRGRAS